jgi:hypothetical protein
MSLIVALMNFLSALSAPFMQGSGLTLPSSVELAHIWKMLPPATCMPNHCFCEPVVNAWIRQPINTWTNLAFILAAAMTVLVATGDLFGNSGKQENTNLIRSQWIYPAIYAYTTALVGTGSMFYHGTMVFYGQVFDILGMYLLSTFMALYNLSRVLKMRGATFFGLYGVVNIVLGTISTVWPEFRRPIFIGILVIILASELLARKMITAQMSRKMLAAALISLIIGCIAWILDINLAFCMPNSWLQLHSIWHIGMAAAIWFLYLYYRSEQPILSKKKS